MNGKLIIGKEQSNQTLYNKVSLLTNNENTSKGVINLRWCL